MDELKAKIIYIHHLGSDDLAYPIMNRLIKADNWFIFHNFTKSRK
jgi:Tat protein secretion system quality control protein TatD with DNase activity